MGGVHVQSLSSIDRESELLNAQYVSETLCKSGRAEMWRM